MLWGWIHDQDHLYNLYKYIRDNTKPDSQFPLSNESYSEHVDLFIDIFFNTLKQYDGDTLLNQYEDKYNNK